MTKKILFVYNNRFGQYPILYEYCTNVLTAGYEVYYIGVSPQQEEYISSEGIKVFHVSQSEVNNAYKLSSEIKKQIKRILPDLIHVFHFRWCFLLPLMSVSFSRYILDVRTLHVANRQGKHSPFTFLKNRITWVESQFYGNAIALTTDIKKILSPSYKKIPVFPLGANVAKLQPNDKTTRRHQLRQELHISDNEKVFIYSGTLSPARRIDIIIEAFIKADLPLSWLIIAGDDKDDPQSIINLKTIAASSNGLAKKIIFTGFVEYNRLIDYYLCSDIGICFIPQTIYYDLQPPTKLFEYMAAGLVTIATRTSANMAVITDEVNGYLCNDSVSEFSLTLIRAEKDYNRTSSNLKESAFKTVKNYSWEHIIRTYILPYYEQILNK